MDKIVHLEPHFYTGESTIQPVVLWANGRACYPGITKHASVGNDFFKTIKPEPGHTFVYVLALGAWETYGENRNGDSFPEFPYMEHLNPPAISAKDVLPLHYKTFEEFGHNYRHHANKDPEKKVGDVVTAFWNPQMHRVELLVKLINSKAPDLVERIADGEFPPVSMGTRVKYDVCSICYNRAPTRAQYCDHLKNQMKEVINGKKISALNPSPKFFDISWVFRGADKTAFMMKKVANPVYHVITGAEAGEYLDTMRQQKVAARKLADMDKVIQGLPVASSKDGFNDTELSNMQKMRGMALEAGKNTPDFSDDALHHLSQFPLGNVFSSLNATGLIQLSTPEVTKLIMFKSYPTKKVPEDILSKSVAMQQGIMGLFEDFPNLMDQIHETGAFGSTKSKEVDDDVAKTASPYFEKRSGTYEYLKRRFLPGDYKADEIAKTTPFTLTDPATGQRYKTTRGAATVAHDEIAKRNLYKTLGGAALLTGAYKLMSNALPKGNKWVRPLTMGSLALGGTTMLPDMGPHYMTDQGVPIPTLTELAKTSSAPSLLLPAIGTLGAMTALGHDYQSRMRSGVPLGYEGLPLSRRVLDAISSTVHEHPLITGGAGLIGLHGLGRSELIRNLVRKVEPVTMPAVETIKGLKDYSKNVLNSVASGTKLSNYVSEITPMSTDTVIMPDVALDKLAEWIGMVIIEG